MKKIIPFMLGSLLLLGATACNQTTDTATADSVRSDQISSDARARAQRDTVSGNETTDNATANSVRSDQMESDARARAQRDIDSGSVTNVTLEYISANLADYLGQTVSIRGDVEEIADNYGFLLDEGLPLGGKPVLIINASGQPIDLVIEKGMGVQVTGEVGKFVLVDIESKYGLKLDKNLFANYENQPVIVAQSMALSPDPSDISNNPEAYYSQRLAIQGNVATVLNANAMTINDGALFGGAGILAISPNEAITVVEGKKVVITGVLRSYVYADIERDHNLTWDSDFQKQIEVEYQDKPVFIIDSIYPSAM